MTIEDLELVVLRVSILFLVTIFGLPANILVIVKKWRAFKDQSMNDLSYIHLAFVDLLLCVFHTPIGILLELYGYFSLHSDLNEEQRSIFFLLNKQISMRVFSFTSLTSQTTLIIIALSRCWRMFFPFATPKLWLLLIMLLFPDVLTITFMAFFQKVPSMYLVVANNSLANSSQIDSAEATGNWSEVYWNRTQNNQFSISDLTDIDSSGGKTMTESHGLLEPLVVYTVLTSLLILSLCYGIICYKIRQGYRRLTKDLPNYNRPNHAQQKFLRRQVNHVKTQLILVFTLMVTALPTLIIAVSGLEPSYAVTRLRSSVVALGSAINPFVYCLLTADNRRALRRFFRRTSYTPEPQRNVWTLESSYIKH